MAVGMKVFVGMLVGCLIVGGVWAGVVTPLLISTPTWWDYVLDVLVPNAGLVIGALIGWRFEFGDWHF